MTFKVVFLDSGREPQCPSDPKFPEGKIVDMSRGSNVTCETDIPYPAPRCGVMIIQCETCKVSIAVTVAGRPDDPRLVRIPCMSPDRHHQTKTADESIH
jgi:predicted RNA-binding Zn-ribbon protein involved in translation (DUF1610 family)